MKVLTVRQPAAGAILTLGKDVENRTWTTSYRGPLAIQAAAAPMAPSHPFWRFRPYLDAYRASTRVDRLALHPLGVIIALADLVDCHEGSPGCCPSPWAERSPYPAHWLLENVREVPPWPWKGALGLRDLPADIAAILLEAAQAAPGAAK